MARFVAVEGTPAGDAAEAEPCAQQRTAVRRQLREGGRQAAVANLWLPASLMLALCPLGVWALWPQPGAGSQAWPWLALAWGLTALALAGGLLWLPRRRATPPTSDWVWPALLGAAALCLLLPSWAGTAIPRPVLAAAAMFWAVLCSGVLAPWRRLSLVTPWLPLAAAAGAGAATGAMAGWAVAGVLASLACITTAWARHRSFGRELRRMLALDARARALEVERDTALRTDQEKSRFVAIASHDLRQPVHALGLFAATLQKRLQHTPDEPLVRNFLRAVEDLERSFNSMLDISRLDGSNATPLMHTFPLRDLFRRLQMQYAGQAELSGLGLRFSTGGKSVTSDPQLLERIIGNLVQNAIKYTAQGGVVVVARSTATHVNVEVWDTGAGIPATELPRVFQEFYQVAPGRRDRSHGLGMGLAIVKRLALLLGHRLEVASRPGHGTMFRVGIPIGTLPGIQDDLAPADTRPMAVDTPQMVLIVEDEEPIREGLRVLLQEWGYQTITAASAAEAEQAVLALEGRVDLVLSDLQLSPQPGAPDGVAVVESVRRLCGYAVPAVIVTGDTSRQAVQLLAARGDPVLFKPVQPRRLFDAMRAALG